MHSFLNFLHPFLPVGEIQSAKEWISFWNKKNDNVRTEQPPAWFETFELPKSQLLDFSRIHPVTNEDYLLAAGISKFGHTRSRGRELFSIQDASIIGPEGAVISPDNKLFREYSYTIGDQRVHPVFKKRRMKKPEKLEGNYATLVYPLSINYYHWVVESLPNIFSFEPYLSHIDGFFIPRASSFHYDSLRVFGIDKDKIIELDFDSHYVCHRLYISSFNSGWAPYRWLPERMQKRILPNKIFRKDKKIFISRNDSTWRKVINEAEVMELLRPLGYEAVELSSLDFHEQAMLFHEADTVISPHGAGLTNILFCRPGTTVLEIHPRRWTSFCYVKLADIAGCQYFYMIGHKLGIDRDELEADRSYIPPDNSIQADDIEIPLDKLELFIGYRHRK